MKINVQQISSSGTTDITSVDICLWLGCEAIAIMI